MGTAITLSLNKVDLDYGKHEMYLVHHWLFPPDRSTESPQAERGGIDQLPLFETTLGEARFRMTQLGYSRAETEAR